MQIKRCKYTEQLRSEECTVCSKQGCKHAIDAPALRIFATKHMLPRLQAQGLSKVERHSCAAAAEDGTTNGVRVRAVRVHRHAHVGIGLEGGAMMIGRLHMRHEEANSKRALHKMPAWSSSNTPNLQQQY